MFGKLREFFRGRPAVVRGTAALPEGEARSVDFGDPLAGSGRTVILCRVEGKLHALDARCPHEDGRISPGPLVEGRYALCPLHNYRFDPRDGSVVVGACRPARTYRVAEEGGDAKVWI